MQKLEAGAVSLNIVVTKEHLDWLNKYVGQRKKSAFIRQALDTAIKQVEAVR